MTEKIKNPEYVDLEKTRVRFKLIQESGIESVAELTVPKGKQRGLNKYWDRIMDEFDIEEMRRKRNEIEAEARMKRKHEEEKRRNEGKMVSLRELFDAKTKAFELPYIQDLDTETKSAIRRAPNLEVLNFILNDITKKFMEENNMEYNDHLDYLDDLEEEAENSQEN